MSFEGFGKESFDFFQDLARNNNKPWFDANRSRYEAYVTGAFRSLLDDLEPFVLKLNARFEVNGKTNGNFSRINRDIRFSKDKSPYKPNFYLYFFDSRHHRSAAGRLYVGLSAECMTVGFSIYGAEKKSEKKALEAIFRERMKTDQRLFDRLLGAIVRKRKYETYWHRQEKGDWAQHPALPRKEEDWQTLQAWVVRKVFMPGAPGLHSGKFARRVETIFSDLYPIYIFTSVEDKDWHNQVKKSIAVIKS
ncbi:MAG: DUF2461 family protein [Terriglobia bacterium]